MAPSPDPQPTAPASGEAQAARRGSVGFSWAKFNEGVIPTLLVGVVTALMLFFFNETSDRITRLEENIDTRFAAIDARFVRLEAEIDARFTRLEENLEENIDTRFAAVDARFVRLEAEIDARFTKLEENQQEIALTLARLVALLEAGNEAEGAPPG